MRKGRPDEKGHRVRHDQDRDCEEHKQDPRHNASTTEKDVDYRGHGIQFRHPSDWSLVEDVGPGETTIAVHSPGTSYWTLTLLDDAPDPNDILETVLDAYRDEYKDIDVYESTPKLSVYASACDLDFVCLDLVNSVTVLAVRTNRRTVLIVAQGTDHELELTRSVMESITKSFSCEEGLSVEYEL